MKIHAVNGPLTIALAGTRWEGKGLDADAKNGPLTLKLPDDFASGVRVETSDHAPFCAAPPRAARPAARTKAARASSSSAGPPRSGSRP